jgi:Bacterial Ig domain
MRFCLLIILFGYTILQAQPTIPPPPQTDEIIIDNGAIGKADPNDRIRYKVTIQNTGTTGANGTQLNIVPDLRTTFVAGTFRSSPLALPDSYASTGNVGITIPAASGLKANDFDDNIPGLTITAGTFATTQGGSIMISADGSFMYTPPAGFTGSDTYTYTLNDANGVGGGVPATDLGLVTMTVSNLIWFIDNSSVAATSDGRLTSPFKTLADFNTGSATVGDLTYIEHTGTNYTGGIVLQDNERLYGEGHTGAANLSGVLPFTLAPNSKTLPNINGSRPVITNSSGDGVTLAMNNNLRGFDVGNCSDFGMDNSSTNSIGNLVASEVAITNTTGGGFDASNGSGASMNAVFGSISSTGGVNGINLTNSAGTFTVNGGTITNPTGTGVLISGGSVVFNSSAVITDNSGFAVDVDNHDSGNVTFSGNITSTGTGIRVQNCGGGTKTFSGSSKSLTTTTNNAVSLLSNTGATINLSEGGLVISTSTGVGFNATGGGTINVFGSGNTINSTSATALNVSSTTIGANNLIFQSISSGNNTGAADPVNGIVLNATGGGMLSVTGTGSLNTGGTIQFSTSDGISITSATNTTLNYMTITNSGGHGISGTSLTNFLISNSSINNAGNVAIKHGISFDQTNVANVTGTMTVDNVSMTGFRSRGISVWNYSGSLNLTITNSDFNDNHDVDGTSALMIRALTAASMNVNITSNSFDNIEGAAFEFIGDGTGGNDINVLSNVCTNSGGPDNFPTTAVIAINIQSATLSTFDIKDNDLLSIAGEGIVIVGEGNLMGRIGGDLVSDGNTIVVDGVGDAARVDFDGLLATTDANYTWTILIKNNSMTLSNTSDDGIQILNRDHTGTLNLTIENNTISGSVSEAIRSFDADRAAPVQIGPFAKYKFANNTFTNIAAVETIYVISDDQANVCAHITGNSGNGTGVGKNFTLERRVPTAALQISQATVPALSAANSGVTISVNVEPVTFNGTCTTPTLPTNL